MIPAIYSIAFSIKEKKSKTYDYRNINSTVDGLAAIKQAAYIALNTPRYKHAIYSWNYGFEYEDLIGQNPGYVYPELERRIKETLLFDERIKSLEAFDFSAYKEQTKAVFTVNTIYGSYQEEVTFDV